MSEVEQKQPTVRELAEIRAEELAKQLGVYKVHPLIFKDEETGEDVVGYVKEPARILKLRILDKAIIGGFTASAEMLDIILIKEASDPRIYSELPQYDKFNLGAVNACYDLIKYSIDMFKKK